MPVVNENDTTATDEITFGDNDFLAAQVAILLDARLLVLLTNVDGVFSADPGVDAGAALIESVEDFSELRRPGDRRPHLGLRLRRDAQQGRRRRDGERGGDPGDDLQRDQSPARWPRPPPASRSAPASPPRAARRRASSSGSSTRSRRTAGCSSTRAPRGSCARAAPACCRSGSPASRASSRPATRSRCGRRRGGRQGDRRLLGGELSQVIGMKSAEVRELLPHAADEVIHRDRFVLASEGSGSPPQTLSEAPPSVSGAAPDPPATLSGWRDHDNRSPRSALPPSGLRGSWRAPRRRPRTRRSRRPRGCSASAAPRSSRRMPPTSPTSAPRG